MPICPATCARPLARTDCPYGPMHAGAQEDNDCTWSDFRSAPSSRTKTQSICSLTSPGKRVATPRARWARPRACIWNTPRSRAQLRHVVEIDVRHGDARRARAAAAPRRSHARARTERWRPRTPRATPCPRRRLKHTSWSTTPSERDEGRTRRRRRRRVRRPAPAPLVDADSLDTTRAFTVSHSSSTHITRPARWTRRFLSKPPRTPRRRGVRSGRTRPRSS